jgi:acyl-CoA reductase-like NAD-dependent aldehyde dehydrogenase
MRDIESGLVYFNALTTGAEIHLPFGGMKQSGNGHRELGSDAVDEFNEVKSILCHIPEEAGRRDRIHCACVAS